MNQTLKVTLISAATESTEQTFIHSS